MSLQAHLKERQKERPLLLMTHLVLGYPSFEENEKVIEAFDKAGVELVELQIPYSEPSADGPVLVKANAGALKMGTTVDQCMTFARRMAERFPKIRFLFMTYYNIVFTRGVVRFLEETKAAGLHGCILPDLPLEEAEEVLETCKRLDLVNVFILTPTNSNERMKKIVQSSQGFLYCVGRRGVTGLSTAFDQELADQIAAYKEVAGELPVALGFGVKERADLDFLRHKADIAVIGSKLVQLQESGGAKAVEEFLVGLRD